jgi:oligopeptidase B
MTTETHTNTYDSTLTPPIARKVASQQTLFGQVLQDDYAWLRDKESAEVVAYLEAENAYTEAWMKPAAGLRDTLYREMLSHIKETDESVPYSHREH